MSIQEHLNKIRNAVHGREVRESIAKGIETAYNDASEKDNANMEVKIARGTHPNLRSRLDETTAQLAQKADIADLPSGAYTFKGSTAFAALPATGNTLGDVYYTTDNIVNYAWTGTAWTPIGDGAFANGSVTNNKLASESVTPDKISKTESTKTYDLKQLGNEVIGGYVDSYEVSDYTITVKTGYSGYRNIAYDLHENDITIVFDLNDTVDYWGKAIVLATSANVFITWKDAEQTRTGELAFPWLSYDSVNMVASINVAGLREQYPTVARIYLEYADAGSLDVVRNETIVISELDWLDITEITESISTLETNVTDLQNKISLVLPSRVYGVVGKEMNIYLDNVLLNSDGSAIETIQAEAMSDSETLKSRVIWTPTTAKSEALSLSLYTKSLSQRDELKSVQAISVAETVGTGTKKVMVIGDSKVASGFITNTIKELMTADTSMDVELLGTLYNWTTDNRHEGRGGWSAADYCTLATKGSKTNAFWDADTSSFNFSKYMATQGYTDVDYVFINLGTNDVGTYTNTQILAYYQTMIDSIHAYNPLVNIVIGLTEGIYAGSYTNTTSDPKFNTQTNLQSLRKDFIAAFDNRDAENIFVCPLYLNMDLKEDYNTASVPLSFRDSTKTRNKVTDPIHQSSVGFRKNADTMYYTIKYIESLG
ncbi:TPA: SGNH/GDSL hydrolase family protein [Streptococcus suis]